MKTKVKNKVLIIVALIIILCTTFTILTGCGGAKNKGTIYIGETANVNNLDVRVVKVENTKKIGNEYLGESTAYNYLIIDFSIKNNSNKEKYIDFTKFSLQCGDKEYEMSSSAIWLDNGFYLGEEVGAGMAKTIKLLYETPTTSMLDKYTLKFEDGNEYVSIILTNKSNLN